MPVALVARVTDTQANQSFDATFERFPVRIGRNQLNDLHVDRPYVSQFHAALDVRDGRVFVRDLGSTNGTVWMGRRLARDEPIDVTSTPEIQIGPVVIQLGLVEAQPKPREAAKEGTILDVGAGAAAGGYAMPAGYDAPPPPGAEDPFVRQAIAYVEAYRAAWSAVYSVLYDHLARLPPELRINYIRRIALEQPAVNHEADFQTMALYYGVDTRLFGDVRPPQAALAALSELARTLTPGGKPLDDVAAILTFVRRLRDAMQVFLKCFVSLRDGYKEFEVGVLARVQTQQEGDELVSTAKDAAELGRTLLAADGPPDAARQLHDIFVDVMSHQVALLNGVMEGVKTLLTQLAPKTLEEELDRSGKKGGLFSNKFEALWKLYEVRHGDYSGEDKGTFLIIFGPQFSRAYAASAGEDYNAGEAGGKNLRFSMTPNQMKR